MELEGEIFFGYKVDPSKLEGYGFRLADGTYRASFPLEIEDFHADVFIKGNDVSGRIYDETFGDEYALFRNHSVTGDFVGKVRESYQKVLLDIRKHCFIKVMFLDEQSTRIAQHIIKTYGDQPEFPWKKFPQFAIFRNRDNHRWYAVFMTVKDGTLGEGVSGRSIVNIKPYSKNHQELIQKDNVFPGWHMDKNSWVSVSLSDYFEDEFVESLIEESYQNVNGKKAD